MRRSAKMAIGGECVFYRLSEFAKMFVMNAASHVCNRAMRECVSVAATPKLSIFVVGDHWLNAPLPNQIRFSDGAQKLNGHMNGFG